MAYREQGVVYQDIWEWDILLVYGDVKIIGRNHAHLDHCSYDVPCECSFGVQKLSSSIVRNGAVLREDLYEPLGPNGTGQANFLLASRDGDTIEVMSGKTYRLRGPRVPAADPWAGGSIWIALTPKPEPEPGAWVRLCRWVRRHVALWSTERT